MNNSKITYTAEQLSQIIGVDVKCIEQNVSLAQRTWIHRGGTAAWWFTPNNYEDLIKIGKYLYKEHLQFDVIGHTSNIYFTNTYNPEVILDTKHVKNIRFDDEEIVCDTGVPTSQLARECINRGICGYEGFIDLPGTVGGAVVNNSGCFGSEMSKVVNSIELLTKNGLILLTNTDLKYTHRNSVLKNKEIIGIVLRVRLDAKQRIKNSEELRKIAAENHEIRISSQEKPAHNLGSTFANISFKRNYQYFLVRIIVKLLTFLKINHFTILKIQKQLYLRLQNKMQLARYISDKNLNTYLFLDEYADKYFQNYIKFIESIYNEPKLEIEIK